MFPLVKITAKLDVFKIRVACKESLGERGALPPPPRVFTIEDSSVRLETYPFDSPEPELGPGGVGHLQ